MELADLNPEFDVTVEGINGPVTMRKLSVHDLLAMQNDWADVHGENASSSELFRFYAELLAATVTDPKATADEWAKGLTVATLMELGTASARLSGLIVDEEKKSESEEP